MNDVIADTVSEVDTNQSRPVSSAPRIFGLGALFLLVAVLGSFVSAYKLVFPGFLGSNEFLSFGRIVPLSDTSLLIGWLSIAGIAVAYHIVGGAAPGGLAGGDVAWLGPLLVAGGTAAGMVGLLMGESTGIEHFDAVWWSDAVVLAGLLVALAVVLRTAASLETETTSPAVWFSVAGIAWTMLAFLIGSLPEVGGVNVTLQTWFAYSGLVFGGLLSLAVAAAYYVIADVGGSERGGQLSYIGFWSLTFVAGWLGTRFVTHSPLPDWLETVGVLFALVLFVPIWTILVDLSESAREGWLQLSRHTSVKFLIAGAALLAIVPVQGVLHAFRSSSSVVQFTAWDSAFDYLLAGGAITMWLFAFGYRAVPALAARDATGGGRWHFLLSVAGLGTILLSLWAAGLQQGYSWVGLVNSGEVGNVGRGFRNSVEPLEAWYGMWAIGAGVFAFAQAFLVRGLATQPRQASTDKQVPGQIELFGDDHEASLELERKPIATPLLVRGVLGLAALAALATFVVPSFEAEHRDATVLGETRDFPDGSQEAIGREVYIQEGCAYCHTQQVRPVITDVGLGPVSQPGDYSKETPALLGSSRIGPDLMHAGSSDRESSSAAWTLEFLKAPKAERPWSIMPSYDHLSTSELNALAIYIAALK